MNTLTTSGALLDRWQELLRQEGDSGLLEELSQLTGDTPAEIRRLVAFARDPMSMAPADLARSPLEYEFLRCLRRAHRRQIAGLSARDSAHYQIAPQSADALHDYRPVSAWSAAQALNAVVLRRARPSRRTAVVVCMRDDGLSILEWVAHYRAIGVDSIFIYSNDNSDGSAELLMELAHHEVITYIENRCDLHHGIHPQRKAFAHALHLLPELWDHEWVFFLDSDELFIPGDEREHSIRQVVQKVEDHFPTESPSAVCFHWRWCLSGETYAYRNELLLTRFQHSQPHQSPKSLVRIRNAYSMSELHFPSVLNDGFFIRADLSRLEVEDRYTVRDAVYDLGAVNHYWHKSFEEYANKKWRGDTVQSPGSYFSRSFDFFFTWNAPETPANFQPPPPELVARVQSELDGLLKLPNVNELHTQLVDDFPRRVLKLGADLGLPVIFEATRVTALKKTNLALRKPARQSSLSQWSTVSDPQGAVSGVPAMGGFNFHTESEVNPWWEVDLQSSYALDSVFAYNRNDQTRERSRSLQVLLSLDGENYSVAYDHAGLPAFGGYSSPETPDVAPQPLCVLLKGAVARFVRLQLQDRNYLHLDQVEVYGQAWTGS